KFAERTVVAAQHRRAVPQGVDDGKTEPLVERWVNGHPGLAIKLAQATVRNSAEEADSLRARAAADGAGASPKQPALRPDPPQFGVCRQSPGFEKPFEQECTVLAWLERGNDQNEMLLPFDCLRRGVAADAHARSWRADEHS